MPVVEIKSEKNNLSDKKDDYDDEIIWLVKNKIFERDISKQVRKYLKGGIFFKDEECNESEFSYLPLIRVELTFMKEKGFFKCHSKLKSFHEK